MSSHKKEYVAMEWDHKTQNETIKWLVMECAGVSIENGGIQALKPRRDFAYFVDPVCAVPASKIYADMKNNKSPEERFNVESTSEFVAYPWDHAADSHLIKWAILRWNTEDKGIRTDIAYFLDPETAEQDSTKLAEYLNANAVG